MLGHQRERVRAEEEKKAKAVTLAAGVWESYMQVNVDEKDAVLYAFLRKFSSGRTLVFCNTVTGVRRLVPLLKSCNMAAYSLHASMQQVLQRERERERRERERERERRESAHALLLMVSRRRDSVSRTSIASATAAMPSWLPPTWPRGECVLFVSSTLCVAAR
jgi:hypothetical protein